ncbi:hypothetical protein DESPIG_01247 [Desulfovibrio piger ATCC 29098]|uniref:Uncharacterized protein n=1 Tax=Desulfovibrio piger ATCC 29098 TaxID=411464 RepID=B6WT41_9BACT|nr:hypothetical protein DESPIG_01247 [Desulfovibrio piger ATCC 29098]
MILKRVKLHEALQKPILAPFCDIRQEACHSCTQCGRFLQARSRGFLWGRAGATLYNIRSGYGGRQPAEKIPDSMAMGPRPGLGEGSSGYGHREGRKIR